MYKVDDSRLNIKMWSIKKLHIIFRNSKKSSHLQNKGNNLLYTYMKNNKKNSKIIAGVVLFILIVCLSFFKTDLPQPLREYLGMEPSGSESIHRRGNAKVNPANPGELPDGLKVADSKQINSKGEKLAVGDVIDTFPDNAEYSFAVVNGNKPGFTEEELASSEFQSYGDLDYLGRCRPATAMLGRNMMPTEKRGSIGMIKPSGWHTKRYDKLIADKYLYNRCHLIGYQLSGQNANRKNLITGTRYLNVEGMLPFEDMLADYIKATDHHVLYRVRPIFYKKDLVARGVQMEAQSIEDDEIRFNVFIYNVQPDIEINYKNGNSKKK